MDRKSHGPIVLLARKSFFSSGYDWKENPKKLRQKVQGGGGSFVLEVRVWGVPNAQTQLVVNLTEVEAVLVKVISQLDKKHLNRDVTLFKTLPPTLENIAHFCFDELKVNLGNKLIGVRLRQGEDDWVDLMDQAAWSGDRDFILS